MTDYFSDASNLETVCVSSQNKGQIYTMNRRDFLSLIKEWTENMAEEYGPCKAQIKHIRRVAWFD